MSAPQRSLARSHRKKNVVVLEGERERVSESERESQWRVRALA